jgi:hypothetical protein
MIRILGMRQSFLGRLKEPVAVIYRRGVMSMTLFMSSSACMGFGQPLTDLALEP